MTGAHQSDLLRLAAGSPGLQSWRFRVGTRRGGRREVCVGGGGCLSAGGGGAVPPAAVCAIV